MANRLAASTSPYLQQHADNPVDWYEWGDEAFAEARRRDVPLLISVGYAACHWCHVMAHESFEDAATAELMNRSFVAVKVDREERPDVDAVYMAATQAMTGQGGWPMTVFATPDGEPFYCGTYYPPRPVGGMPSFPQLLQAMAHAWSQQRDDVAHNASALRDALASVGPAGTPGPLDPASLEADTARALDALAAQYDARSGGFGGAPKFPPSMVLEWLLRRYARTGDERALAMAEGTLDAMARGGMADQLGGGFARYSVDATWTVPHFEKMLDDNAELLRVYAHRWRATGSALALRVVEDGAAWLLREMRTPQGGFAASLDADTRGVEGQTYVWTPEELADVLGPQDGAWAADLFGVTADGTFEHGTSVLTLHADPDDHARYDDVRARLLAARDARPQPGRDDKVVAAWNGLAIAALADAGALLGRPAWVSAATDAAELLWSLHVRPGATGPRLTRTSRDGVAGRSPGVLADYADVAEGYLALFSATGDPAWFERAGALLGAVLAHFRDDAGGFWDTADDETDAVLAQLQRPQEIADGPAPSGPSAAAGALLTYAALSGSSAHREAAEQALDRPLAVAGRYPRAAGWALAVAEAVLDGPREVAVVGRPDDPATHALVAAARGGTAPGAVVAVGGGDDAGTGGTEADGVGHRVPLLRDRPLREGQPTAYVCRGFVCDLPETDPQSLRRSLGGRQDAAPVDTRT
ncbi:thioredoxin domain-containing protein [Cellulomonas wangsupingiae]|uniref:thioredoxin domain-containing protein n=1 Tax=Cellulomonas wangsupingiae TaxID=2968085 RepID=UPI001D0F2B45|nr:thioredoxin domain-containing protein [Cellulomonas wangsupingiae]MCM0638751.1 thioredoxin domain-containing protein [Cellulomonas wangsupingiae]